MHSYSIDSEIRRVIYVALGIIAFALPTWVVSAEKLLSTPFSVGYPISFGITFGFLHFLFDRWFWRLLSPFGLIANLSGKWTVEGRSSYKDGFQFTGDIIIRQTFSSMEVFGDFANSTSKSILAGICLNHAVPIFRYAFESTPKNLADAELHRHPGLIELRISDQDTLAGDYFSGKHRVRWGEMTLRRVK